MSVAQAKSKAAKPTPLRGLKAQLEASIAEAAPSPRYQFPPGLIDELNLVTNETVLDLKLMASALWTMSFGADPEHTGLCSPQPGEAMKWLQRELERKAERIEDVTSRVASEIRSRLIDEKGPL